MVASPCPEHQWEPQGIPRLRWKGWPRPWERSRTWSPGHTSPVPPAHGPGPAGCRSQEATIVWLPEPGTVQALFWAWRKRKRKQRKEPAVLGRGGGRGWRHLPCLQKELQGPLSGKVAMLDQRTLRPQRSWWGAEALRTLGEAPPPRQALDTHLVLAHFSKKQGTASLPSAPPEPPTHLPPPET